MKETVVIKIGGSSLSSPEKVKRIAENISKEAREGKKVVTVVSAIGKTTDNLLELVNGTSEKITQEDLDNILSMGERTSARLFCSALKAENLKPLLLM